ncbi:MAG: class I SAM-dependent methyltransferase [Bacteroidota bacterium]
MEQVLAQGPVRGRRVLEVGAGSGRDSIALASEGAIPFILDYSMASLETARGVARRHGMTPILVRADALRLPFRDGAFDVVFHQGLLEHFRDPMPLLRENARALKEEGILLVDVPQRWHLYTLLKHAMIATGTWFAGWETEFSIGELERLLRRAGVRVVHRYGAWMVPGLFYRSLRAFLLKTKAARLPLYPPAVPVLSGLNRRWRDLWDGTAVGFRTYFVIGAVGRKGPAPGARG